MEALAKKGLEYEERLKAQEREREAEFESQREQARIKETRVAHTHKAGTHFMLSLVCSECFDFDPTGMLSPRGNVEIV